jgi:hypothetical protein
MDIIPCHPNICSPHAEAMIGGIPDPTLDAAKDLLIEYLKKKYPDLHFDRASIVVERFRPVLWSDASLGYPEEGKFYEQMITPGYEIHFSIPSSNELFIVHTNGDGSCCSVIRS